MTRHFNSLISTCQGQPETTREGKRWLPLLACSIVFKCKAENQQLCALSFAVNPVSITHPPLITPLFLIRLFAFEPNSISERVKSCILKEKPFVVSQPNDIGFCNRTKTGLGRLYGEVYFSRCLVHWHTTVLTLFLFLM